MATAVGADIESICSKCGDVWHVIVAKVADKIAKVQCKECGALHRYRPPGGVKKGAAGPAARKRTTRAKNGSAAEATPAGPSVEPDMSLPVRNYSIRDAYAPGERIDHPKFGLGVVERAPEPGRIEVYFPEGRKILAAAKPSSTLAPPTRTIPAPAPQE